MKQVGYVNESGKPIVRKQIDPKKASMAAGFILLTVMLIVFIFITVQKSNKNKTCNRIEDIYINEALSYAKEQNLLPTIETESITIHGDDLVSKGRISKSDVTLKENYCTATITITKYKEDYIKTVTLKNCGYCTTDERYGAYKESTKLPKGNIQIELQPTFNYYETQDYYTKWTNYYTQDKVDTKKSKEYDVYPLKDEKLMPQVPDVGHIVKIIKEDKTYYKYRDRMWKFYKNPVDYSAYSSTQPSGYSTKDTATSRKTDWTEWSLNYPDTADYRSIKSSTGYRWYYKEKGKKIYWNSGQFTPEQPGEKYENKDKKKVTLYSYQDTQWRWYNGTTRRQYTSYASVAPRGYNYRDDENTTFGSYSMWYEESKKDETNSYYREEITEVRSRYRTLYQVYSLLKLNDYVTKDEFEKQVGKSYKEFAVTPNIKVDIKYTYKYRKVK